jgi:SsrA-binding protein
MAATAGKAAGKAAPPGRVIARNRRASFDYALEEPIEAGLALMGSEVKALRVGQASITEAFAEDRGGEIYLCNAFIGAYALAHDFGHAPRRPRKLLLHRRQANKIAGALRREGYTLVPLSLYFNHRGLAKLSIALGKGKKLYDKRQAEKAKEWGRARRNLLKD